MLAKQANTNGYRWVQKYIHHGNYVVLTCIVVTCLILPRMGSSVTNFQEGSQKASNMKKNIILNIPLSAFDVQIIKSSKNWYLKYNISQDEVQKIVIDKPCDIEMLCRNNNKLYVVVNVYSITQYEEL